MADRFLRDKAVGDESTRQALDAHRAVLEAQRTAVTDLSARIHAELGAMSSAQSTQVASMQRQLGDLEKHFAGTRADALAAKQATEGVEARLARIENATARVQTLAVVALVLLAALLILMVTLFLRAR